MQPEHIPASLESLAAVIGMDAAMILAARFAGRSVPITRANEDCRKIADSIGAAKAARLIEAYKGTEIYFPMLSKARRAERDRMIRDNVQANEKTMTTRAAVAIEAVRCGICERDVWRILSRHTTPSA